MCPYQIIDQMQEAIEELMIANQKLRELAEELIQQRDRLGEDSKLFRDYAVRLGEHAEKWRKQSNEFQQAYLDALSRNNQLRSAIRTALKVIDDEAWLPSGERHPIYIQLKGSMRTTD